VLFYIDIDAYARREPKAQPEEGKQMSCDSSKVQGFRPKKYEIHWFLIKQKK
jgi:hypothetical protein